MKAGFWCSGIWLTAFIARRRRFYVGGAAARSCVASLASRWRRVRCACVAFLGLTARCCVQRAQGVSWPRLIAAMLGGNRTPMRDAKIP